MKHDEIAWLGAEELTKAYRDRELSPVDATRAILDRIDALNPRLNAYCLVDHESAMSDARASEARWLRGEPLGPIDGVPASIKDLILTKGWPTLRGSLTTDPAGPWDVDAPATARLREAGAVLLGKTTTPEFGWRGSTDSPVYGITRNPWRLDTTPGGSSGGATAAVAAGLGPFAVGTDGGGSVRIPAAFTGTVGLKAHFGRIPAYPLSPMGTVAHIGPQTRTVADCARLFEVIARPDSRDWMSLPPTDRDWSADVAAGRRADGIKGLRIAYSPRLGYVKWVDARIEHALDAAAKKFAELGAIVERVDPGFDDCADVFRVHWFSSARHLLHRLPEEKLQRLDPGLREVIDYAERYTIADFMDAQLKRAQIALAMARLAQRYDLMLTPATAVLPFAVGRVMPEPPNGLDIGMVQDWTWWTPFSYPFNLTQQPAIVQPCGFSDDGLPIALQLVAPNHREDLCLRAAAAYEAATDWHKVRPPIA
ncbi:amidase [Burkholderiaceae bacterium FT117]|uniref:amidase n=1 Tax=Zeimonas sediminis TaxID=2944268 RepID=UPI002342D40A|nr:amidase [Zeimonas sediminis]MCM5568930.1 amidase [Zeimonas sediminis]